MGNLVHKGYEMHEILNHGVSSDSLDELALESTSHYLLKMYLPLKPILSLVRYI